jgi:ATP-dependent RNA helicase DDX56/DBP9
LIFVNTVDRGFRLKLFLEQFGVNAGVLNCELPLASRWHAIQAFNRGAYDILIATDDPKLMTGRAADGGAATDDAVAAGGDEEGGGAGGKKRKRGSAKAASASTADAEFGVSRGVDFTDVTAVLNMDLPTSIAVYKHRIGRTARAGKGGTAISLVSPEMADEALLAEMLSAFGDGTLHQFPVDMSKLGAFRYRTEDALRSVTRAAVKEARLTEIKRELLHSKKLTAHFEANPDDLELLRHDKPLAVTRKQPHLTNVPSYLKPETEGATEAVAAVGSSARRLAGGGKRRKLFGGGGKHAKNKRDPLRSFRGGASKKPSGKKSKR